MRAQEFSVLGPHGQVPPPAPWTVDPPQPNEFKPIGKLINVQIVESSGIGPETVQNGVIIPDSVKWKTPVCRVIEVGPKVEQIKAGDYILISASVTVHDIRFNDHYTQIVHEDGVFGVITEPTRLANLRELHDPKPAVGVEPITCAGLNRD